MSNRIEIKVIGAAGTGKSTIIRIIKDALFDAGLQNVTIESDSMVNQRLCEHYDQVDDLIKKGTNLSIVETQGLKAFGNAD